MACSTPATGGSGTTTTASTTVNGATTVAATATIAPVARPEANQEAQDLIDEIDPSIFKMAVMLPYGGRGPSDTVCGEFWTHHWDKHIVGEGSPNTPAEIMEFLAAVESGDALLTKASTHMGGGLVSLFKFKGEQWLMFIGERFRPSIFRPAGADIQRDINNALGKNTLQQPGNKLQEANKTSARCFRETAPDKVLELVPQEVQVPISEYSGFDFNNPVYPIPTETVSAPTMVPVPVGSYGMDIHIQGTPPAWSVPGDYTYSPEHAAYLWTPDGGFGLTPAQMVNYTLLLGASPFVVVAVIVTAEYTIPVLVLSAPAAGQLVPVFAP
ncbi:hypothetical protein KA017_00505 [Candidatus Woesebacteria bacterium]|nr:hypothetical protein [Candidatus Woesebacteria bacterium]